MINLSKIIDRNSSRYEKYLCIGDYNSETSETALRNFCDLYKMKNLVRDPTCFKNPNNPSCINLFLTNCSRSFQDTHIIQTGLTNFHKMNLTVLKMYFTKQKHETIFYRNYKKIDNLKFKEALNRELMKHCLNDIDYENFHEVVLSILKAKLVRENKTFWRNIASLFSNKIRSKERTTLTENENIISNDRKVAETFQEFFSNVVKNLNISWKPRNLISGTSQTDPVLQSIDKLSKHPSIKEE